MMAGIGTTGLIVIVFVALLLFGPSKLPELGRAFGRTLKEFKNSAKELTSDKELVYENKDIPQIEK
nr:twin-arginine translocase TatA/TatE family subunit [Paenibacillus agaridevorans]